NAAATAAPLLALLTICALHQQPSQALVWTQAFSSELATRFRLCNAPPSKSVVLEAVDAYNITDANTPGLVYSVKSSIKLYVIFCSDGSEATRNFLVAKMPTVIQWRDICDNTINLAIYLQSSVRPELQNTLQPCNYEVQHSGITEQQVTAWVLVTYTANWDPVWVNRTLPEPRDSNTTASVMLSSSTDSLSNATWYRVQVNSGLLEDSMSPNQRVQAVLTSISTAPGQRWWLLICSVLNATEDLLVTISDNNETVDMHMDCGSLVQPTLVLGAPANSSNETLPVPAVQSSSGGYWGPTLQRLLTEQTFGGLNFCNASKADGAVLVNAVDEIVIGLDSGATTPTVVRATLDLYVAPCDSSSSLALGDAFLKVFLQGDANWTEVCADSANPTVTVNLVNRTALRFNPCPAANATAEESAAKLAWCILALNSSDSELMWTNRDTTSLVEPSAASVSFRILGDASNMVLQWGNVLVNGISTGDNADRLVQVFQSVSTSYWPVVCQLLNPSTGSFMLIEIQSGENSSKKINLYANCSFESELSSTPPPTQPPTAVETTAASTSAPSSTTPSATSTTTTTTTTPTTTTTMPTTTTTTSTTTTTTSTSTTTTTPMTTTTSTSTSTTTTTTPTTTTEASSASQQSESTSTTVSVPVTLSAEQRKDKKDIEDAEGRLDFGTQTAVLVFALVIMALLSTVGICKLVAPRSI
ncbi:hypothetical protein BOX15_Mlig003108g3, partial [Macrostomum lignano]